MEKKDIESRDDIYKLVTLFYTEVRKDKILGAFFNNKIKDWDTHFQHLTTFWESSLFMTKKLEKKYIGNPLETHVNVDKENNNSITEKYFGIWLNYWIQTIDKLFQGIIADNAKHKARKMSSFLYLKIFEARVKNN